MGWRSFEYCYLLQLVLSQGVDEEPGLWGLVYFLGLILFVFFQGHTSRFLSFIR
jgi:hypothetical protein